MKMERTPSSKQLESTAAVAVQDDPAYQAYPTPNTTSCVSASPDVRQAPAEAPQPTKAAKKRAKKANKHALAKVTEGLKDMKAVPLNGDALGKEKEADEKTARQIVICNVQAAAAYIAARLEKHTELATLRAFCRISRIKFVKVPIRKVTHLRNPALEKSPNTTSLRASRPYCA